MTDAPGNIKRLIYLDHAATTPTHPDVLAAMRPYFTEKFGNPSSLYGIAGISRSAVATARGQVARALGAQPEEIAFTAGGTESDNWAIKGVAYANRDRGTHIVTTAIEHHAVLHTCEFLERQGFTVTYLPVDRFGRVDPADVAGAITDETVLVSVMAANNEIGTVEPIAAIGAIAKEHGIPFHCDAVQAIGHLPIDVDALSVDLLSLSGHKFYGPKGTGALYIRKGTRIDTFMHGGGQEAGRRAGTENLPGIVGLGAAIERACTDIGAHAARLAALRDRLIEGLVREIPGTYLNGHPNDRLPGNANCSFAAVDGEALLYLLDAEGICCSTGSACSSGSESPSHVLAACGIDPVLARASLRFTLGDATTPEDIETVIAAVADAVRRLRALSPLGAHYS